MGNIIYNKKQSSNGTRYLFTSDYLCEDRRDRPGVDNPIKKGTIAKIEHRDGCGDAVYINSFWIFDLNSYNGDKFGKRI